jgi:hypothetical protein
LCGECGLRLAKEELAKQRRARARLKRLRDLYEFGGLSSNEIPLQSKYSMPGGAE